MRVLAISGSLRANSHNTGLLRVAAQLLPPEAELVEFDGLAAVPPYNEDDDRLGAARAVAHLRDEIARADAVLIATPEYNASLPGVLKNAVDWASRPFPEHAFRDKPVLVVGASTGMFGAVWAQAELRKVLNHIGAHVQDSELAVGLADEAFDDDGRLTNPELAERFAEQLQALVREAQSAAVPA
jgi:chromate reductase